MKKHLLTTLLCVILTFPILTQAQDPASCEFNYGSYTELAPMPIKVFAQASGLIDGKIYMTCGMDWNADSIIMKDHLLVYDPATDTWDTTGARIPVTRCIEGGVNSALEGKFYVIGGVDWVRDGDNWQIIPHARVDVYDPQLDEWKLKSNLPIPIGANGLCSIDGKLYVTGGMSTDNDPLNTLFSYDPGADEWTELSGMTTPRKFHASVALNGKIYVISGNDGNVTPDGNGTKTCEVYDPDLDQWSDIAPLPLINIASAACVVDGEIYLFGGTRSNVFWGYKYVYKYNPEADTWISLELMPLFNKDHAVVPIERTIYMFGGTTKNATVHQGVYAYELSDVRLELMISDSEIYIGDSIEVDLSECFSHVDGGDITYSVCLDEPGIIDASINGNMLTASGLEEGLVEVSVLAESGGDKLGDVFQVKVDITGTDRMFDISPSLNIYPNPAGEITTLAYMVQSKGLVRLEVYDLLGKRVAIPLNEYRAPGEYKYQLSLGDLKPGIYFCDLTTASERVTVKLIVKH